MLKVGKYTLWEKEDTTFFGKSISKKDVFAERPLLRRNNQLIGNITLPQDGLK